MSPHQKGKPESSKGPGAQGRSDSKESDGQEGGGTCVKLNTSGGEV